MIFTRILWLRNSEALFSSLFDRNGTIGSPISKFFSISPFFSLAILSISGGAQMSCVVRYCSGVPGFLFTNR